MQDEADDEAAQRPDDFFAATPGLRWILTGVSLVGVAVGGLDAAVNGPSPPAGFAVALSAGLAWTAWRERMPTRHRVGWLAWIVAVGIAVAWPGAPAALSAGLAGVGLGALVPSVRAIRRRDETAPPPG